jgi:hypothetical protein
MFLFLMIKGVFSKPASIIFSTFLLLFPTGNAIYSTAGSFATLSPTALIFGAIAENIGPTV